MRRTQASEALCVGLCVRPSGPHTALPPADDESDVIEPSGSIRMLDVENVWPSAGKSKGRAEEKCLQVKALPFWGSEAI